MDAGIKQINQEKKRNVGSKDNTDSPKKTKPEISNSFLQRIISLLKKEELI
ncbi:hypothetical protein [Chryseobacterium profundimaris]|uniref:Uncharacterized protein n=1 Tax=Chryseobacterium profundimaris TaxID=1387275 RepID=A0ABY1P7S0_9FLAO|nr:hypothetical protein [Chryseobacterium profundimaris]SMP26930.1 hypothetical protein SAMN06264346_10987 [Chryseobacterium profundimaris]